MNTSETMSSVRSLPLEYQVIAMALPILLDRIQGLSKEDRDSLFELMKELPSAADHEDREGISRAMLEILDCRAASIEKLNLTDAAQPDAAQRPAALKKWVDFVSQSVKKFREAEGLTQAELSKRSGLPQSHLSRIETGKISPSKHTLEKISKALNIPLTRFYDPNA